MMEYFAEPNSDIFIRCQLGVNDIGLFPQTKIYSISNPTTSIATVNLDELSNGLYGKAWDCGSIKDKYFTQTLIYTDSGHTSLSPIDSPDSDSINVGRYQGGGYIAPGQSFGSSRVARTELTDNEIKRIAKEVFKILKPELDKKSEFNPSTQIVKTDIKIPEFEHIDLSPLSVLIDKTESVLSLKLSDINNRFIKTDNALSILGSKLDKKVEMLLHSLDLTSADLKEATNQHNGILQELGININQNITKNQNLIESVAGLQDSLSVRMADEFLTIDFENDSTSTIMSKLRKMGKEKRVEAFNYITQNYPELVKKMTKLYV